MNWNRLRYSIWAPVYDRLVSAVPSMDAARRRSIAWLDLQPAERVLLVGAGTGLDLDHLPGTVHVTAVDVTPAMLERLRARAARRGIVVDAREMDARALSFDAGTFDAVVLHLVLAVMPQPDRGLREVARVTRPGGRITVFDKFLRLRERPPLARRMVNAVVRVLFSDLNRRLEPMLAGTPLVIERDEPALFGGAYRIVKLRKPAGTTGWNAA